MTQIVGQLQSNGINRRADLQRGSLDREVPNIQQSILHASAIPAACAVQATIHFQLISPRTLHSQQYKQIVIAAFIKQIIPSSSVSLSFTQVFPYSVRFLPPPAIRIIININLPRMSKIRTSKLSRNTPFNRSRIQLFLDSSKSRYKETSQQNQGPLVTQGKATVKSHLFQQTRCRTMNSQTMQSQKDAIFHRNIREFRQSFQANDTTLLPFLASLRNIKDYRNIQLQKGVVPVPFAAERETINQKTKKSVNDIKCNPFRLSKAYYRWHHRSGLGVREGCEFECNLRLSKRCETLNNPERSDFKNEITPIRFRVEKQKYKESDLVCSRQRKVFTMEVQ